MATRVSRWRTVLTTVIVAYGLLVLLAVGFIYSGLYDIAADTPHWGSISQVFDTARVRSIKEHASGITVPAGMGEEGKLLIGVEHFAAHCAVCHGAPGVPKGDIANGLYPEPPDLAVTANRYTAAELFWIIKHGIKMTGMPAWGDHDDDEVWATVAFLKKLPGMTPEDYAKLVMQVMAHGGHHHPAGGTTHDHPPGQHH